MLAAGVGLFTAASAGCALAPDAGALVAARAVQGAGAALMLPLALALLSAAFPPQRRAWALGMFASVTGIAVLAGPVVGGAVAQGLDWPWIFWLNVPIGLVMIPLVLTRIPAAERESRASLDPAGLLLAAGGALCIVWALIRADSLGWTSPEIAATLAAGIVLGAAFIAWELRAAGTHGAAAPVPLAADRGGQRGHLQRVRPADGHGVLHGAVPGDRAGLRAVRRRAAAAAGVRHLLAVIAPFAERSSTGSVSAR